MPPDAGFEGCQLHASDSQREKAREGFLIRPYGEADAAWAERLMAEGYGGRLQARRGELADALGEAGLVAEQNGAPIGLLTYRRDGTECELAFMISLRERQGVGKALIRALQEQVSDCSRIWLVTTNDNLGALRFYQRCGFRLSDLRPGAVDEARRRLKPGIPPVGEFGIPIRDEIELELMLGSRES
jgi:ribosomal protein S18 acetylase RimI-like enzyme